MRTPSLSRDSIFTCLALLLVLLWDWSGQDMAMAAWFGSAQGFALRNNIPFDALLHRWPHHLAWIVLFGLMAQIRWPIGVFKTLPRASLTWSVGAILLALLLIQELKYFSLTSCPWDLREFGGTAEHLPHWRAMLWRLQDGGGGRCFPAGSASSGFAFIAAYPFLRLHHPRLARLWLWGFSLAGLVLGLAQQMRGAHFMSHTLWTAWLCWGCGMLLFWLQQRWTQRSRVLGSAPLTRT